MLVDISDKLTTIASDLYGDNVRFAIADALEALNEYPGWKPVESAYDDENPDFIESVQTPITTSDGEYITTNISAFILYEED